jgi:hypothetical protein
MYHSCFARSTFKWSYWTRLAIKNNEGWCMIVGRHNKFHRRMTSRFELKKIKIRRRNMPPT